VFIKENNNNNYNNKQNAQEYEQWKYFHSNSTHHFLQVLFHIRNCRDLHLIYDLKIQIQCVNVILHIYFFEKLLLVTKDFDFTTVLIFEKNCTCTIFYCIKIIIGDGILKRIAHALFFTA
jgi:hypothetical protein